MFFQPHMKLKYLCLSCPLKHKRAVSFAGQSTTTRREVAAFGFHETTSDEKQSKGWVGNAGCHRAQTLGPFLVRTKNEFMLLGSCGFNMLCIMKQKSELLSYSLIGTTLQCTNTFVSTSLHQRLFCHIQRLTGGVVTTSSQASAASTAW